MAALLIGASIGLIAVVILTVILWKYDRRTKNTRDNPARTMVKELVALSVLLLGGNFGGLIVFARIMTKENMIQAFLFGEGFVFFFLGLVIFLAWLLLGLPRK